MTQSATMETTITLFQKVPGLNGSDGLMQEHFHKKKERVKNLIMEIKANSLNKHKGPVQVTYTRHTCQPMDWDNHCASFKHVGDALVKSGTITDDNPSVLRIFRPRQVKVKKKEEQRITIHIIDIP